MGLDLDNNVDRSQKLITLSPTHRLLSQKNSSICIYNSLSVCVFVCGSALLQPVRSVFVASEHFFILVKFITS